MSSDPATPKPNADHSTASQFEAAGGEPGKSPTLLDGYNIVSDTVTGVNFRKSDNMFQLKVITVCVLIGVPLGALAGALFSDSETRMIAARGGGLGMGFAGVVLGLFGSGIYLMVYRAVRHFKGKHD